MLNILLAPSDNHDARPEGAEVDLVVVHYTGMETGAEALHRLRDPAAKVSAHYLIEEDGRLFQLVEETRRAWHAGVSCWAGRDNVNHTSIGIELVNPGVEFGYRPFPEGQIATLEALLADLFDRYDLPPAALVGHSDVAPGRKADPGELFPWGRLARQGYGLPPVPVSGPPGPPLPELAPGASGPAVDGLCRDLRRIGYKVPALDGMTGALSPLIGAFQRHFMARTPHPGVEDVPACHEIVTEIMDEETRNAVDHIAALSRS
ncbi:N-acetylmuramoyl-L-alanine amidase [Yunchengibacter salinarum]|uniref:N-acetylmuramoyl-L-alanine amidase n=1 Tax=Yunchengibacter salinarum TaxID=3133399 RepID=UPI0035B5C675